MYFHIMIMLMAYVVKCDIARATNGPRVQFSVVRVGGVQTAVDLAFRDESQDHTSDDTTLCKS